MLERPESFAVVRRRVLSAVAVIAAVVVVVARPADAAALVRAAADGTEELLSWWQAVILGVVEASPVPAHLLDETCSVAPARILDTASRRATGLRR